MRIAASVLLLASAIGCAQTDQIVLPPTVPAPRTAMPDDDPYHALDLIADDISHDAAAVAWHDRLRADGRDREALEVATRVRDDARRQDLLDALQPDLRP